MSYRRENGVVVRFPPVYTASLCTASTGQSEAVPPHGLTTLDLNFGRRRRMRRTRDVVFD
jgi:hypothetical protein